MDKIEYLLSVHIDNVFRPRKGECHEKIKKILMLLVLSLCLCVQTVPAHAATTAKTTTSTTKKVSVKKETMKKAATKTATTTKKTTSKKKTTKKNGSTTIVTETTIVTTVKTSTKKKSKTKTIETTVVTTIKTTTTTSSSNSSSTVNTDSSGFNISKFSDVKDHINQKVYNAFNTLGFQLKINPSLSTTGAFSVQQRCIQLKTGKSAYLYHELGHFVSALNNKPGVHSPSSTK